MADEGFREIQLSGKQLISLFMGAAVVLVAAFLCGVLVGRGVRARQEPAAPAESVQAAAAATDPTAAAAAAKPAPPPEMPPPAAVPPPETGEDPAVNAKGPAGTAKPPGAGADAKPKEPAPAAPGPEPAGNGFYLKIVAYRDKPQADAVASRLAAKGYGAYVVPLSDRSPALYSVRVGKFQTRKEADTVRRRLEKEEQFKPLVTR
jgi:cell division septation protein DedD